MALVLEPIEVMRPVPTRADEIIASHFNRIPVNGPALIFAQERANDQLKAEGLSERVSIEKVVGGTVHLAVHQI